MELNMFSSPRKQSQQLAHQLIGGHCTLIAWWTLRHAGVLDAMARMETEQNASLDPLVHATATSMAPDILEALLEYLTDARLVTFRKDGARLTPEGRSLLEHEDGTLGMLKAYESVLGMSEHLLAKLKSYSPSVIATGSGIGGLPGGGGAAGGASAGGGVTRKSEYLMESQARRYAPEVYPAISDAIATYKMGHLLDLSCGGGELLTYVATRNKQVVGVGIGADPIAVRKANQTIDNARLDKRLIAISANPFDVCLDTQRTFDRIGLSRQLWKELDGMIAVNLFTEFTGRPEELTRILSSIPRNFPTCTLLLAEPVISPRFETNYYAPEMKLLLRMTRSPIQLPETWRQILAAARMKVVGETPLSTDGLCLFACRPM